MPRQKQRTPELADRVLRVAVDTIERGDVPSMRTVAAAADTSPAALYELFGDKSGLLRAVCADGFRRLAHALTAVPLTGDPRSDLVAVLAASRRFALEHSTLFEAMFAQPLTEVGPDESDLAVAAAIRRVVMHHVDRCLDAGVVAGDRDDIAHALITTNRGLITAELTQLLASTPAGADRRWAFTVDALIRGLGSVPTPSD
jgi:AcrR family transcriptional regulator